MINCAKLTGNIVTASCRISAAGVNGDVVLINWDDWQNAVADSTLVTKSNDVFTKITLATGKYGVHVTSHEKAFGASYELVVGTYINGYRHSLTLRSFERTEAIKGFLNKIAHGRYVAIVINRDSANDETKYEVYGAGSGLVASASAFDSTNTDGIVNELTIASADGALEGTVPNSFYVTDLETTAEAYAALYNSAS